MDEVEKAQQFWWSWDERRVAHRPMWMRVDGKDYEVAPEKTGYGNSKHVFALGGGRVLMLPPVPGSTLSEAALKEWHNTMAHECEGSAIARAHGLLAQELTPVRIEYGIGGIDAMVARDFSDFQAQGIEVRDVIWPHSRYGNSRLLESPEACADVETYRRCYQQLVPDLAKLFFSGLSVNAETFNLAFERDITQGGKAKLRLMLYDFAPRPHMPPTLDGMLPGEQRKLVREYCTRVVTNLMPLSVGCLANAEYLQWLNREPGRRLPPSEEMQRAIYDPALLEETMAAVEHAILTELATAPKPHQRRRPQTLGTLGR